MTITFLSKIELLRNDEDEITKDEKRETRNDDTKSDKRDEK